MLIFSKKNLKNDYHRVISTCSGQYDSYCFLKRISLPAGRIVEYEERCFRWP
jgi:hypothetical protein